MEKGETKKLFQSKWLLAAVAVIGAALIIIPGLLEANKKKGGEEVSAESVTYYTEKLEERIKNLVLELDGIEKASVLITLENNGEYVYARNTKEGNESLSADYVIIGGENGDEAVKLAEINPVVRGVAVVCTGGNDISVQGKIITMLSSALGITSNRITVAG